MLFVDFCANPAQARTLCFRPSRHDVPANAVWGKFLSAATLHVLWLNRPYISVLRSPETLAINSRKGSILGTYEKNRVLVGIGRSGSRTSRPFNVQKRLEVEGLNNYSDYGPTFLTSLDSHAPQTHLKTMLVATLGLYIYIYGSLQKACTLI